MQLYLLRPIETDKPTNPWKPWYDKAFGFVIRAESEAAARRIADSRAGDENCPVDRKGTCRDGVKDRHPWLSRQYSTCVVLSIEGPEEEIIRDFASA